MHITHNGGIDIEVYTPLFQSADLTSVEQFNQIVRLLD